MVVPENASPGDIVFATDSCDVIPEGWRIASSKGLAGCGLVPFCAETTVTKNKAKINSNCFFIVIYVLFYYYPFTIPLCQSKFLRSFSILQIYYIYYKMQVTVFYYLVNVAVLLVSVIFIENNPVFASLGQPFYIRVLI
jgi:hypothetical protein